MNYERGVCQTECRITEHRIIRNLLHKNSEQEYRYFLREIFPKSFCNLNISRKYYGISYIKNISMQAICDILYAQILSRPRKRLYVGNILDISPQKKNYMVLYAWSLYAQNKGGKGTLIECNRLLNCNRISIKYF